MNSVAIRAMTWNIHGGLGLDGVQDLQRIADVITAADPDILALQEVDNRNAERTLLTLLGTRSPYTAVPAVSITAADGDYGQLLLSRWPVRETVIHDISITSYEPRRLISLVANAPFGELHVLATHFGLRFSERRAQAAILCEAARSVTIPLVALGDFNDWLRVHSISAMMDEMFPSRTRVRTFPARLPLLSLDRIYCNAALRINATTVPKSLASDHVAVIADLTLVGKELDLALCPPLIHAHNNRSPS
jgi:endonuclease/exonuclease/phosphatase family metal-dependent hydrolase